MDGFNTCRNVLCTKVIELKQRAEKHVVSNAIIFLCEVSRAFRKTTFYAGVFTMDRNGIIFYLQVNINQ